LAGGLLTSDLRLQAEELEWHQQLNYAGQGETTMPTPLPDFFLVNPVGRSFKINDRFNEPRNYTFAPNKLQLHEGIDIMAIDAQNQPVSVLAAQRGLVEKVGFSASGYGNYVRIVHQWNDETWVSWYGHMSEVTVEAGRFVLAGQKIGVAGTTGFSSGIHLHLTLQHLGHGLANYTVDDVVDPEPFFRLDSPPQYDEASFVTDVTVPDGSEIKAGQSFQKTWRVRNTGTTTWNVGYALAFADGHRMGGASAVVPPALPVQPGQVIDVGVLLVAPELAGHYRGMWQFRNAQHDLFAQPLYADIQVKEVKPFNEAAFVADVTCEDGTIIQPGEVFVKTWRIRNSGTIPWTGQYALRFFGDDRMEGPENVPLGRVVACGETVEVSVNLTAPKTPGRYRSTWKLCNAAGTLFEYELYAEIRVPKAVAPAQKLNEMRWVADVTIPDEMEIPAGSTFVKTWRVHNSGDTTWGPGYTLAFFGNEKMGGSDSVPLTPAKPGATVDISVTLTAPTIPGLHRSTWKPRDAQGSFFEFDLFALINVVPSTKELDELNWVADVTVADGSQMHPGESFNKVWRVRNTGTSTWGQGYNLAFSGDKKMNGPDSIQLPNAKPGDVVDVSVMLTAPGTPGRHKSTWKARNPQGKTFEYDLFALIDVVGTTFDMLAFLQGDGRQIEIELQPTDRGRAIMQTQVQDNRFYHVQGNTWEELWADDNFIYRGSDTTLSGRRVFTLTENGKYGCAWIPRLMSVGVPFRRMPLALYRRKRDGGLIRQETQVTWIKLEAIHGSYKLPGGIELPDVAVFAVYKDKNGQPVSRACERYFFAKGYGPVARETTRLKWCMVADVSPGSMIDNQREVLDWLNE
jgi:hypothetical protein